MIVSTSYAGNVTINAQPASDLAAVEVVKDLWRLLSSNTQTGVRDADPASFRSNFRSASDGSAGWGALQGVEQQVAQQVANRLGIGQNGPATAQVLREQGQAAL